MAKIEDVKEYWETNPLLSHEIKGHGTGRFFDDFDRIKRTDSDKYALRYWAFDKFPGKSLLDVGCGPGWITVNYAMGGARVSSIDLTSRAVEITKKHLAYRKLKADVREGNAEAIPYENERFDAVVSSGVLHHTPDTFKAFTECFRVLKPGGSAKITLYHLGILHAKPIFRLTTSLMKLLKVKHPGADLSYAKDLDDFIRQYDGAGNPVGIAKTKKDWSRMLEKAGFTVLSSELHFFPKRFLPFGGKVPGFIHLILDRCFGTMIYFELKKPDGKR